MTTDQYVNDKLIDIYQRLYKLEKQASELNNQTSGQNKEIESVYHILDEIRKDYLLCGFGMEYEKELREFKKYMDYKIKRLQEANPQHHL